MQFLGIGPLEFLLILVIAVIVLGPQGMVKAAREAGKLIRKIVRSPIWHEVMDTSREIRDIPRKIVREAGIEEDLEELRRSTRGAMSELNRTHFSELPTVKKPAESGAKVEKGTERSKKEHKEESSESAQE
jgi:sec-independent protein translocase protein TatB